MNRKELVYDILRKYQYERENVKNVEDIGLDASEISELINADRSNTSRYLNELVKEEKIIKLDGRPVKFVEKEIYNNFINEKNNDIDDMDPFKNLIGFNSSLKSHIEQAKSAVLYPPRGLHTLITGPTGTGKSTFAEKIYEYAMEMKTIDSDAKFVVFNCAEYAENPQLVMSQLFGHIKGAFTGADKEKSGLIDEANGGVLFLDEIHRLSPECQELLFMLMDKHVFRRLGETGGQRKADVLIIGATTEDINASLLQTFLRRMPVTINLPSLKERHLSERLQLIESILSSEQTNMDVSIRVHKDALIALLLYECKGNVGQLKADIQLLCARGFLDYKVHNKKYVEICTSILPEHIQEGLLYSKNKNDLIDFIKNSEEYHYFNNKEFAVEQNSDSNLVAHINDKYNDFIKMGRSSMEISNIINSDLDEYFNQIFEKYKIDERDIHKESLLKIVDIKVLETCEDAIQFAEMKLGRKLSDRIKIGMIMHINSMVARVSNGTYIKNDKINEIVLNNPKELKIAKFIFALLEEDLSIKIPKHEIGFLTMFLCAPEEIENKSNIGVIVMAHGNSTASSMADFVNNLLNTHHCRALDMPMDMSTSTALNNLCDMINDTDEGRGVLLLVDMGSLNMMGEMAMKKTGKNICTVEMVSTLLVIEAVRKASLRDTDLISLKNDLENIYQNLHSKISVLPAPYEKQKTIITTCISGKGVAVKIDNIIKESIDVNKYNVVIKHLDILSADNIDKVLEEKGISDVIAVVGTVDLKINNIPFIPINELIVGNGINILHQLLNGQKYIQNQEDTIINKTVVKETLKNILTFLNYEKASSLLIEAFNDIFSKLALPVGKDVFLRFIMHTGCMLERVIKNESIPHLNAVEFIEEHKEEYKIIKEAFFKCEEDFNIFIPKGEISYIIELLH